MFPTAWLRITRLLADRVQMPAVSYNRTGRRQLHRLIGELLIKVARVRVIGDTGLEWRFDLK